MSARFIMRQVSHLHIYICESKLTEISVDLRWLLLVDCKGGGGGEEDCSVMDGKLIPCLFFWWKKFLWWFCFALTLCAEPGAAQGSSDVSRAVIFWSFYLTAAARWLFLASLYIKDRKRNPSLSCNVLLGFGQKRAGISGVCQLNTAPDRSCGYWQWWA